jgi:hypothetical protein
MFQFALLEISRSAPRYIAACESPINSTRLASVAVDPLSQTISLLDAGCVMHALFGSALSCLA